MISIIICAHNRKEYLLDAIKSAVNQTIAFNEYEIIVVKNFKDAAVDEYIDSKGILSIYTNEETFSGKVIEALNVSKGDIISFLDDDDMFLNNKLERIEQEFSEDGLVYVHNDMRAFNDKGDPIDFKDNRIFFNMSSISVKREIIKIDILRKSPFNLDALMYAFALESKGSVKDLKDKLTYYRVHNSVTHTFTNLEDYRVFCIKSIERSLKAYIDTYNLFSEKNVKNFLLHEIILLKIRLKIYSGRKVFIADYINFLFSEHQFKFTGFEYKLLIGSLFFRNYIVKKLYRNELEKINAIKA